MKKILMLITIGIFILVVYSSPIYNAEYVSNNNVDDITFNSDKIYKADNSPYQIGVDIPAGDYYVVADDKVISDKNKNTVGEFYTSYSDEIKDIKARNYFTTIDTSNYRHISNTDGYLYIKNATVYPASTRPIIKLENGTYKPGAYIIGKDIPAGTYTLKIDPLTGYKITNYVLYDGILDEKYGNVVASEVAHSDSEPLEITVTNGQVLESNAFLITPK